MSIQRRCLVLVLALSIAGCGFQLKGSQQSGGSLDGVAVVLRASNPRGELANAVSRSLKLAGATVVEAGETDLVLNLGIEQFTRRNLSLTAQARAAEVELTLGTRFSLRRGDAALVPDTEASITRQMLDDPGNVVGKNEELSLLRNEMRRDIADQIVRRVNYSLDN